MLSAIQHQEGGRAALDLALDDVWAALTAPGAPFELESVKVRGYNIRQYRRAPGNVRKFWNETTGHDGSDYLVYGDERLSYRQAHVVTTAVAAWLTNKGVGRGDRVAIAMRNYPEWLLIHWACALIGAVTVGMNAWWVSEEMAFALADAKPAATFCDRERLERLRGCREAAAAGLVVAVRAEASPGDVAWADVIATGGAVPAPAIDPDDAACILYTSGTTGTPKGAELTQRGCISTGMNLAFATQVHAVAEARVTGSPLADALPLPPTALVTTPLFHVTALGQAYAVTAAGGTLVLMYRWDAAEALRLIEAERITSVGGVPTMARELLDHPAIATRDLSTLQGLSGGGAQTTPDLIERIEAYPWAARASSGYGLTEAGGVIAAIAGDYFSARPASCGRVLPTFDVQIVDDRGDPVPVDATGEILVRGAGIIREYINQPAATAATIVDGRLRTGDVGRLDEQGYLFIVDRIKDMILRGGENVYCSEVELALFGHTAVTEACVFGVPDERLGEEVGAAVVLRPGSAIIAADLRAFLVDRLARFKIPRYIWLLDAALPRNASGKFLRRALRTSLSPDAAG